MPRSRIARGRGRECKQQEGLPDAHMGFLRTAQALRSPDVAAEELRMDHGEVHRMAVATAGSCRPGLDRSILDSTCSIGVKCRNWFGTRCVVEMPKEA